MYTVSNIMKAKTVKTQFCSNKNLLSSISGKCLMLRLRKMDPIEAYTGSKRSQDKRTAALRARCGLRPLATSVIGETTARRASVFNSIRTVTNTKVCGPWIRSMARERTGEMKITSFAESTPVTGSRTRSTEEVPSSLKIVIDMTDTGSTVCHRAKAE